MSGVPISLIKESTQNIDSPMIFFDTEFIVMETPIKIVVAILADRYFSYKLLNAIQEAKRRMEG